MDNKPKTNLPNWTKILIGAVALFLGLICGIVIAGALFVKNVVDKSSNPAYKKSVAASIAVFPDPLPPGFSFGTAMDQFEVKTVLVNHSPEQMDITFSAMNTRDERIKKALDTNLGSGNSIKLAEQTATGKMKVADHDMDYRCGYQRLGTEKVAVLDGRITDVPHKFISITAFSEGTKPFDLTLFEKLANTIKFVDSPTTTQNSKTKATENATDSTADSTAH